MTYRVQAPILSVMGPAKQIQRRPVQVVRRQLMWPFTSKPVDVPITDKIRLSLTNERGVSSDAGATLRMVEEPGNYAGRRVTYFRIFDPTNAKWGSSELRRFKDLDVRRIVHSGHVERDEAVV